MQQQLEEEEEERRKELVKKQKEEEELQRQREENKARKLQANRPARKKSASVSEPKGWLCLLFLTDYKSTSSLLGVLHVPTDPLPSPPPPLLPPLPFPSPPPPTQLCLHPLPLFYWFLAMFTWATFLFLFYSFIYPSYPAPWACCTSVHPNLLASLFGLSSSRPCLIYFVCLWACLIVRNWWIWQSVENGVSGTGGLLKASRVWIILSVLGLVCDNLV